MTTRKSARIQSRQKAPAPVAVVQQSADRKRREPPVAHADVVERKLVRRTAATSSMYVVVPEGGLFSLPAEIFDMIPDLILRELRGPSALSKLARTCRALHQRLAPWRHRLLAVAGSRASLPFMIRSLEPYLSAAQRQRLCKGERQYDGQPITFPDHPDPDAVPACADLVRHIHIRKVDMKRGQHVVRDRYIEALFENTQNVTAIDTFTLTAPMVRSMQAMKSLGALRLRTDQLKSGAAESLMCLTNLEHLCAESYSAKITRDIVGRLVRNSLSTIRSLEVHNSREFILFINTWDEDRARHPDGDPGAVTLERLSLGPVHIPSGTFLRSMHKVIDFAALRELSLEPMSGCFRDLRVEHLLASLVVKANEYADEGRRDGVKMRLTKLRMHINTPHMRRTPREVEECISILGRFLTSFETLHELEITNLETPRGAEGDPGVVVAAFPDSLVQAAIRHRRLRRLAFPSHLPNTAAYFQASMVQTVVDSLPELREFEFGLGRDNGETGRALARSSKLRHIVCHLSNHWPPFDRHPAAAGDGQPPPHVSVLRGFLQPSGISGNGGGGDGDDGFTWERHYQLGTLGIGRHRTWEVASSLGKREMGMRLEERLTATDDPGRSVLVREMSDWLHPNGVAHLHTRSPWLDRIERGA